MAASTKVLFIGNGRRAAGGWREKVRDGMGLAGGALAIAAWAALWAIAWAAVAGPLSPLR